MFPTGLTSLSFESPALHFVAALLDDKMKPAEGLTIPSDMGGLIFKSMDLIEDRGRMPSVELHFEGEHDQSSWVFSYFGHVAPLKIQSINIIKAENPLVHLTFSEVNKLYAKLEAVHDELVSLGSIDMKLLFGSLYLWRACAALPKACEESLGKYFRKMQAVSRYQWSMDSYFIIDGIVVEEWRCSVAHDLYDNGRVVVTLHNGIVKIVR